MSPSRNLREAVVAGLKEKTMQHGCGRRTKDHGEVVQAATVDLSSILGWLEREYQEDGEGFWCNRRVIAESLDNGDLWVIREHGDAVAFQVGDYGTDIVCVRKDRQCYGYGTALFNCSLVRAIEDNVNVLHGECSPPNSLPFWQKMGFEQYGDLSLGAPVNVRRVLHREHDIPSDLPKMEVSVRFFPEHALYETGVPPIKVHQVTGGLIDNRVRLPYRIIGLADDAHPRDLVVKIVVDDGERCFCKAKHDKAKAVGVKYDREGHNFYVDEILIETER